jgi:GcrA cell cycle regulator
LMNTQRFDWTDARVATLKELHSLGLSAGQIAGRMGASRNMVIGKLHRISGGTKVHRGKPAWTPEMIEIAARGWAENKPLSVIGAMIGKTHSQVSQYAQDHRDLFPKKDPSRKSTGSPMKRTAEAEYIAPQFLVPPEGYDAERLEHAKELHEVEARECRWPLNNGSPFMFCAAETEKGATYCVHHRLRARPKTQEMEAKA